MPLSSSSSDGNGQKSLWSSWAQFAFGCLVTLALGWATTVSRISSLEVKFDAAEKHSIEDRQVVKDGLSELKQEVSRLRDSQEERDRTTDRRERDRNEGHAVFPRGKQFDK